MNTPYKNTVGTGKIYSHIVYIPIHMVCDLYAIFETWVNWDWKIFLYSTIFFYSIFLYSVTTVFQFLIRCEDGCLTSENRL